MFKTNEIVTINSQPSLPHCWVGIKCKVLEPNSNDPSWYTRLLPMENRPDGHGRTEFLWTTATLEKW